ncbi:MAG: Fe-S cluster assembly protein SufD [Hyphomicrobiales bacterium]|nr:Fe-S cluster assembly protein SufD [Hyphomicrobiales bacterium]
MSAQISNLPKGAHQAVTSLMEAAERIEAGAPTGEEAALRRRAREQFAALGLPTRRLEAWRYTDLAGALQGPLPPLSSAQDARPNKTIEEAIGLFRESAEQMCALAGSELSATIVFFDGRFSAQHSDLEKLPKSVRLRAGYAPLANGDIDNDMLGSLNLSLASDGFELVVDPDAGAQNFVHLLFLSAKKESCSMHSRAKVRLNKGASLKLLETHIHKNFVSGLQTHLTDVAVGEGAKLEYACIEYNNPQHISLARTEVRLEQEAQFSCTALGAGGKLVRHEYNILFEGGGAKAELGALSLAGAGETRDVNVLLHHKVPECLSDTLVKNVLTGDARGVFQGLVRVEPGAVRSNGRQTSKALLLGRDASMNAKPELEIFNDDVECAHGSAVGEIDRDALFYLRARGISENDARQLLIKAFLGDVLERIEDEALRINTESHAIRWMENVFAQTQEA